MRWILEEQYSELTGLDTSAIKELIESGAITLKLENSLRYIETSPEIIQKILDVKDALIETLKVKTSFLGEVVMSLEELCDEGTNTIHTLEEQLKSSQQEVEFMRRKYKLMWDKTIEEYTKVE